MQSIIRCWVILGVLSVGLCGGTPLCAEETPAAHPSPTVQTVADHFNAATLDLHNWVKTKCHDFRQETVEVAPRGTGHALCLSANTLGTDDRTVKYHGLRSAIPCLDLAHQGEVCFTLDWNAQANGCYLTAGAVLCPTATTLNPQDEKDWIAVEYLGVPPGANARLAVLQCVGGNLKELYTEGWPDKQRTGRKIDRQTIRLLLDGHSVRVFENGQLVYSSETNQSPYQPVHWSTAYLYLQQSSHSNYPERTVYFQDVTARAFWPVERELVIEYIARYSRNQQVIVSANRLYGNSIR